MSVIVDVPSYQREDFSGAPSAARRWLFPVLVTLLTLSATGGAYAAALFWSRGSVLLPWPALVALVSVLLLFVMLRPRRRDRDWMDDDAFESYCAATAPARFVVEHDRVVVHAPHSRAELAPAGVHRVLERPNVILIQINDGSCFVIPRRCVADEAGLMDALRRFARAAPTAQTPA